MKDNKEDYIGMEIGVLDDTCKVIKNIIIKDVLKTSDNKEMFLGDDGVLYNEFDLNFSYKATTGALFALFLEKYNYISKDEIFERPMDTYEKQFEDFMQMLVNSGYVAKSED